MADILSKNILTYRGVDYIGLLDQNGNVIFPVSIAVCNAIGYEALNVTNVTAVVLASIPATANRATVTVETGDIRVRWDGTPPTATEGHLVKPLDGIQLLTRADILAFKAIATTATAATLRITYS